MDLGGATFSVWNVTLHSGRVADTKSQEFVLPAALMQPQATGTALFDFVALSVRRFREQVGLPPVTHSSRLPPVPIALAFPFPVQQSGVATSTLRSWARGFATSGCVGKDPGALLQAALKRAGLNAHVAVVCSDAVGELVAGRRGSAGARVGAVISDGCRVAYWELVPRIAGMPSPPGWDGSAEMCVTLECGGFDSTRRSVLPFTAMDAGYDDADGGRRPYDKMVGGAGLGELARFALLHLVRHRVLGVIPSVVARGSVTAAMVATVVGDTSAGRSAVRALLRDAYQYTARDGEAELVQASFRLVTRRSARLAAVAVAAAVLRQGTPHHTVVRVAGGACTVIPSYAGDMADMVDEIMRAHGHADHATQISVQPGSAGAGAAVAAAAAAAAQ